MKFYNKKSIFSCHYSSSKSLGIAERLPPGLRQSVSESVKKEAVPRAKSLTLSLMQVPTHSPGFSSESAMASGSLQARPSRRVSYAESAARSRVKAERENQPYIGDGLPLAVPP